MNDELLGRTVKLDMYNPEDIAVYKKNTITGINEWIRKITDEILGPQENMFVVVGDGKNIQASIKNELNNKSFFTMKNILLIGIIIGIIVIIYYAIYENYENYKKNKIYKKIK
tara:strand:- start:991 stop:1329 length:339 start_codon:yes stop_codon:yes gene_type:complete